MFGMQILDIAIGLVFIYLVLALTCTAINELFAGWLDRRSKNLVMGIRNLLESSSSKTAAADEQNLVGLFYSHPLIKSLEEKGAPPSYIPSRTFALTLLDLISPATGTGPKTIADIRSGLEKLPADSGLRKSLLLLIDEAGDDLKRVQENIEVWFNNAMDRVSGWYKKRTQTIVLLIAVGLVTLLNADTVRISKALSNDSALREALVAQAQEYAKYNQPPGTQPPAESPQKRIEENVNRLQQLGVPLGYTGDWMPQNPAWWLSKILGLLLTAAAASLGAPFWFDVLNKFINVRAAGKSPDEMAKPPEAPPKRKEEIPPK
jgi:hypothetical protein